MPQYDWQCQEKECGHVTVIVRSMADYQVPPDCCDKCDSKALIKIIAPMKKEQIGLVWGGIAPWHSEGYSKTKPIR